MTRRFEPSTLRCLEYHEIDALDRSTTTARFLIIIYLSKYNLLQSGEAWCDRYHLCHCFGSAQFKSHWFKFLSLFLPFCTIWQGKTNYLAVGFDQISAIRASKSLCDLKLDFSFEWWNPSDSNLTMKIWFQLKADVNFDPVLINFDPFLIKIPLILINFWWKVN